LTSVIITNCSEEITWYSSRQFHDDERPLLLRLLWKISK